MSPVSRRPVSQPCGRSSSAIGPAATPRSCSSPRRGRVGFEPHERRRKGLTMTDPNTALHLPGAYRPTDARGAVLADRVFRASVVLATAVALAFLLLPVVAIFLRVPPSELLDALRTDAARHALVVTAETNVISMLLIVVFGTP